MRAVGFAFVTVLAVSVGLSSIVIGSILSTALLIGPPASALKVADRLGRAMRRRRVRRRRGHVAGVVLAYDSYYWFASHRGLPVSFFVVVFVVVEFVVASVIQRRASGVVARRGGAPSRPGAA